TDRSGDIGVTINGASVGVFKPTSQIIVYAQAGDDTVLLQSAKIQGKTVTISIAAVLFGGAGNHTPDTSGRPANHVRLGEAGNDSLQGGSGRDLQIGGLGSDTLHAGSGGDILIGCRTDYDNDLTALASIMAEWGRTDIGYQDRINHLTGSVPGGLNGTVFLNALTVHDDAAVDQLFGGSGQDWFLYRAFGSLADRLIGQEKKQIGK